MIEVAAQVPTQWSQDKALAGVTNALQVHPDINFVFTSSDFLFPSLISALKTAGKFKKISEEGHVLLGGFDGDSMAYQLLRDGYLDADGRRMFTSSALPRSTHCCGCETVIVSTK